MDLTSLVLIPGGIAYTRRGASINITARIDLLTELFASRSYPRRRPDQVKARAKDIRAASNELRGTVDGLAASNDRVELLQRMQRAPAKVAHASLTSLTHLSTNAHFSQSDLHGMILDRPASVKTLGAMPAVLATGPGSGSSASL